MVVKYNIDKQNNKKKVEHMAENTCSIPFPYSMMFPGINPKELLTKISPYTGLLLVPCLLSVLVYGGLMNLRGFPLIGGLFATIFDMILGGGFPLILFSCIFCCCPCCCGVLGLILMGAVMKCM